MKVGGFLPGVKQIANVAALPGIVGHSVGLPDVHSGYGFAIGSSDLSNVCLEIGCSPNKFSGCVLVKDLLIRFVVFMSYVHSTGNMAAFDMDDPKAVVSPGGVGFDINCGVRKNLKYSIC